MKSRIKLLAALAVAFILATQATSLVFPDNTPTVRPHLGNYIAFRLKMMSSTLASLFNRVDKTTIATYQDELKKKQDKLSNVAFTQLSQGVYAKDEGKTHSLVEVKLGEMTFVEHTFTVNGKKIVIRIPKDQPPPSQQMLDQIYGN